MGWDCFGVVRFNLGPLFQGQMRIVKDKSAYNSLIVGARGLRCEANLVLFIFKTVLVVLFRWIHLASGHRCVLGLFYLGFYVAFNTVQVISRQVVGRAEETSTYIFLC